MTGIIDDFYIGEDGRPYSLVGNRPFKAVVSDEIEDWFKKVHACVTIRHNEHFQENPYGPYNGIGKESTYDSAKSTGSVNPVAEMDKISKGRMVRHAYRKVCHECNCGIVVCQCKKESLIIADAETV